MHALRTFLAVGVLLSVVALTANSQKLAVSDSDYMAQALSAAPKAVAKDAAVVRVEKDGSMRTRAKARTDSPAWS